MARHGPAFLLAAALASPAVRAQDAPNLAVSSPPAADVTIAKAIEEGVTWLVKTQNKDGSFGQYTSGRDFEVMADVPGSLHAFKVATTALCWMGLFESPLKTPQGDAAAEKALAYLVKNARVKRPNGMEMYNIWSFGFGLQALAEALAKGAKGASEADIRKACEELVKAFELYQVPDGGFTYYDFEVGSYHPSDSSMSFTTATVLIALHAAKSAGLEVPDKVVARAVKSVKSCRLATGSYLYGPYLKYQPTMGINQPKGSSLRNQVCNLALALWGGGVTDQDLLAGLEEMIELHKFAIAGVRRPIPHESWYQVSGYFYLYGYAYAGMVLKRLPDLEQKRLAPKLTAQLLKVREPDGSFWDYPLYGFHKPYGTGFALMALTRYRQ